MNWTVDSVRGEIARGGGGCSQIIDNALERIANPEGEGELTFLRVYAEQARAAGRRQDAGVARDPLAGIPVSIKDLFDVAGEVTVAGSKVLQHAPAAKRDAECVARLKGAGAIIMGRTNMTEFAYSGVGINPHFGTPANPYDRARRRIPGGSSSGAAVSVSDGMAVAALGSDTGGSVRIPAALCGLTGFKPTKGRVPTDGMFPLSHVLDSIGVIAPTVRCCHAIDAVLRQAAVDRLQSLPVSKAVFAVPTHYFLDCMDSAVSVAFDRVLSQLSQQGARLVKIDIPEILRIQGVNEKGGFAAAESFRLHRRLGLDSATYDPLVWARIQRGEAISDSEYATMVQERTSILAAFEQRDIFDGILCPTVPMVAPPVSELVKVADFHRINLLLLRNPGFANFMDLCSISLPCHKEGDAPVGLMITGRKNSDNDLLACALGVEEALLAQSGRISLE